MTREYHQWHSPALGRTMELLVFGHGGARVLAFPTSMGRFYDGHNQWLSEVLWSKGIRHALHVWDGWCHDWPWWRQMLPMYIGGA